MKKETINSIKIIILGVMLSSTLAFAADWTTPGAAYPAGNIAAPINTTAPYQIKAGGLGTGPLEVFGASQFNGNVNIAGAAVEICNNGIDDNGNGLIDGADPACGNAPVTGFLYNAMKNFSSFKFDGLASLFKTDAALAATCSPTPSNQCSNNNCNGENLSQVLNPTNAGKLYGSYSCSPSTSQCSSCTFLSTGLVCSPVCSTGSTCETVNSTPQCVITTESYDVPGSCADGIDNNGDGFTDAADEFCAITLTFGASPATVTYPNTAVTLSWDASNASSCVASGSWSGTKVVSGTETVHPTAASNTYTLNCTNVGGAPQVRRNIVVNVSSLQPPPLSSSSLYVSGKVGMGSGFSASSQPADSLDISGNIKIDQLIGSNNANLCADAYGVLVAC